MKHYIEVEIKDKGKITTIVKLPNGVYILIDNKLIHKGELKK